MKKAGIFIFFVILFLSVFQESKAQSPVSFVLNIQPISYLISPEINGFSVSRSGSGGGWYYYSETDEITGFASVVPNALAGISINTPVVFLDFTGGGGFLWSGAFNGPVYMGDFAARFRIASVFTLGFHGGVMAWSPKWTGEYSDDNDVNLGNMTGFYAGPTLSVGKKASFVFSIDYFSGKSDVYTYNNWHASSSELNLSGVMFNFGLLIRVP